MQCRCSNYIAVPQIYSHGVHCLSLHSCHHGIDGNTRFGHYLYELAQHMECFKEQFHTCNEQSYSTYNKERQNLRENTELLWQMQDIFMQEFTCIMFVCVVCA